MLYDLHLHSTASDGQETRLQLMSKANNNGLGIISFTDHSYIDEFDINFLNEIYMETYNNYSNVILLNGIELDIGDHSSMHMLGYGFDDISLMKKRLQELKRENDTVGERILENIKKYHGITISRDDVIKYTQDGLITKRSIIEYLLQSKIALSVDDASYRFTGKQALSYVKRAEMSSEEAINLIRQCGGISVLAHPSSLELDDFALNLEIKKLKNLGLNGIEVDNISKHSLLQIKTYILLAQKYDLLQTSGSDYHRAARNKFGVNNEYSSEFLKHPIIKEKIEKQRR